MSTLTFKKYCNRISRAHGVGVGHCQCLSGSFNHYITIPIAQKKKKKKVMKKKKEEKKEKKKNNNEEEEWEEWKKRRVGEGEEGEKE